MERREENRVKDEVHSQSSAGSDKRASLGEYSEILARLVDDEETYLAQSRPETPVAKKTFTLQLPEESIMIIDFSHWLHTSALRDPPKHNP